MGKPRAHLVFLKSGLLLVKRPEATWRQLQDQYEDYQASLAPWTVDQIIEYFPMDYGDDDTRWPFARQEIEKFMSSTEAIVLEARPR